MNVLLHTSQRYGRSPLCTICCLFTVPCCLNRPLGATCKKSKEGGKKTGGAITLLSLKEATKGMKLTYKAV